MPVSASELSERLTEALSASKDSEQTLADVRGVVEQIVAHEVEQVRAEAAEAGKLAVLKQLSELGELLDSLHARLRDSDATGAKALDKRLDRILSSHGFERTATVGETFDPRWHEIAGVETGPAGARAAPGTIVREVGRGYRRDKFVLCTARVVIAS